MDSTIIISYFGGTNNIFVNCILTTKVKGHKAYELYKGFAGGIPHAYTHIANKFFKKIQKLGLQER